jgi:hypothetical protein
LAGDVGRGCGDASRALLFFVKTAPRMREQCPAEHDSDQDKTPGTVECPGFYLI